MANLILKANVHNSNLIPSWDTNLFHLGRLCDHNHSYYGTGQSLRIDVASLKKGMQPKDCKCYECALEQFEQDFRDNKYFLGDKCTVGHTFRDTEQTLYRYFHSQKIRNPNKKYDRICVKCEAGSHDKSYWKSWKVAEIDSIADGQLLDRWDSQKLLLGKLCPKGHDHKLTGQSLRLLNHAAKRCAECERSRIELNSSQSQLKKISTIENLRKSKAKVIFALRMRSLEKKISNTVIALEYDLELAHQDTILFAKRLRVRDQDLSYSRSAKGRHRAYKRRLLAPQVTKSYSDEDLWQRLVIFGGRCAYCRNFVYSHHLMTWDHFRCLSKGGGDTLQNLVPCCKFCNSSKRDAEPMTWFQKQAFFNKEAWDKITTHTN